MAELLHKAAMSTLKPQIANHEDAKDKLDEILISINK